MSRKIEDKTGKIATPEEMIEEELKRNGAMSRCICGARHFAVAKGVFAFQDIQQSDRGYPFILRVCGSCGFTAPYSAVKLGLMKPSQPKLIVEPKP